MLTLFLAAALTLAAIPAQASDTLRGDVNGDCVVSIGDLQLVALRFGVGKGSLLYGRSYDLNGDGEIDIADMQIVAGQFGQRC